MSIVDDAGVMRVERARVAAAPAIAFIAACLGVACTMSLVGLLGRLDELSALSGRFVGWLGVGWCLALAAALVALLVDRRVGAGPAVAVGGLLGVIGLTISRDVADASQVAVSVAVLGAASGFLIGGAAGVAFELPPARARLAMPAWIVPVVAGGAVQAWVVVRDTTTDLQLAVPVAWWALVPAGVVLVVWGVASLMFAAESFVESAAGWHEAWWSLTMTQAVLFLVVMLIGFDTHLRLYWLRPVVLVASCLALAVWLLVCMLLPEPAAKIGFLAVSFVTAAVPALLQLLFRLAATGSDELGPAALPVVLAAAVVGGAAAYAYPRRGAVGGLLGVALACVGGWLVRDQSAGWLVVVGLLVAAGCAAATGGLLTAMDSPAAVRLVAFAAISALIVGTGIVVPLGWALVGDLPLGHREALATSRVLAGLVFSLAVLLAGYVTVLGHRIDRRAASTGISEWGGAISFPGVGGAVIHGGSRPEDG